MIEVLVILSTAKPRGGTRVGEEVPACHGFAVNGLAAQLPVR